MNRKIIIKVTEVQHKLSGLGNLTYTYEQNGIPKLTILIESLDKEIKFINNKAREVFDDMANDNTYLLEIVKNIVSDIIGIPLFRMFENTNKSEVAWSRYLIWYFMVRKLGLTVTESGRLFGRHHSTVIHGLAEFEKEDKFMHPIHRNWKNKFMQKLKEKDLL